MMRARRRLGESRLSAMPANSRLARDQSGAVMILALVFLVAVSFIVIALLGWVGTSLTASAKYSDERGTETAATSAVNLAIQNTRYTFSSAMVNASPPVQCWGSTSVPNASSYSDTSNNKSVDVWCSMVWQPFSQTAQTRTITYSACLDATPSSPSPSAAACAANPILQVVVAFDDYPPGAAIVPNDHPVPCTTPPNGFCGESLTQQSWIWNPDVPSVSSLSVTSASSSGLNGSNQPVSMQINCNGFVPGTTDNFVQETGSNPGPGVVPSTPNVPITPAGQEEGVIISDLATNSVSCSGAGNTNCSLSVTVPAVTSGPDYFVTVTTPGGTSPYVFTGGGYVHFSYSPIAPTVSAVTGSTPTASTTGAITGGTLINVAGTGFYSAPNFALQVVFCYDAACTTTGSSPTGWLASDVNVTSSTALTAVSPAISATSITYPATFYIQVRTVGGNSGAGASNTFTYSVQVPIIFSISPTTGAAGTLVTINGYNFLSGSKVGWVQVNANDQSSTTSDAVSQATATFVNSTQLAITVPTLPNPNGNGNGTTTYVPMVIDPGGTIYSQPYNESNDEYIYP